MTALSPKQGHTKETITKEKKENKNTLPEQVRAEDEKSLQPTNKHRATDEAFESIFWLAGMRKLEKKNPSQHSGLSTVSGVALTGHP